MRGSHHAGCADIANGLALPDPLSDRGRFGEPRHMRVKSSDVAAVLDNDAVSIPALFATENDFPVASRLDNCAGRCSIVYAIVRTPDLQNRVQSPRIEVGAYPGKIHRSTKKRLADAASFRGEVVAAPLVRLVTNGAKSLPAVNELGRKNLAVAQILAVLPYLFVQHQEFVVRPYVECEIDVPGKNAREIH